MYFGGIKRNEPFCLTNHTLQSLGVYDRVSRQHFYSSSPCQARTLNFVLEYIEEAATNSAVEILFGDCVVVRHLQVI